MLHAEREEQAMATNMYLKFIDPNVPAQGEMEVLSWSHGFVQPTSPTRSAAGSGTVEQATHQNLTFTKYLDASRYFVKVRFWCVACSTVPLPAALRVGLVGCTKPWLHERTSISP